jgi:lipoprotein-anchoring transpeptidase ErfK/SrfK
VTIDGISVGGLGTAAAKSRIESRLAQPLRIAYGAQVWSFPRSSFAALGLDPAVSAALASEPRVQVRLDVHINDAAIALTVGRLARHLSDPAADARLVGLDRAGRPLIEPEHPGRSVGTAAAARLVARALTRRGPPIELPLSTVEPRVTRAHFGPVIVIDRGANTLRLFDGSRLVRRFGVATGQARYPTPSGTFEIVTKQRDPWWYPPPSPWAEGLRPVPPGPGNPLGTRWMGLSAAGVGIHGTPSDASIGYSLSHGCIRMHIPEAVWLFEHVEVGTPVVIV